MRGVVLVVTAIAMVAGVLLWQHSQGGGDYVPLPPADPCAERPIDAIPAQLEPLTEQIVLTGLDEAACRLGMTREELVLALGEPAERAAIDADQLRAGLIAGVDRLGDDLPPVSELLPEALGLSGLPSFLQDAAGAIPDSVIDDLLPTDELLHRAVEQLDFTAVLANLQDPAALEPALREAILAGAKEQMLAALPEPLRNLLD